ncbi:hypothetical protein AX15_001160 [Amanita polypyramis BW_CC]|nr:hypothetical protein AX15_001160 [Amanita polypyramis BW_CC]
MSSHPAPRAPRKISSNLSLKRKNNLPSSTRPSYFDVYPRPNSSPNDSPSRSESLEPDASRKIFSPSSASRRDAKRQGESSYVFPTLDSEDDTTTRPTALTPKPYSRTRSRTSPSSKSRWSGGTAVPPLCFSDLVTNDDSSDSFPVVVAAPISGVETMDALVDGMNGRDFTRDLPSLLNRNRFGISGHHPLYQPPLPTPPPGVVLGGGKGRRSKKSASSAPSSDSDGEGNVPTSSRSHRRKAHRSSSRVPSNSTLRSLPASGSPKTLNPGDDGLATQTKTDAVSERPKTVVPSISEIIRTHAPQQIKSRAGPSTTRISSVYTHSIGHTTINDDHDYEPECLDSEQETDFASRSSIDSVADEVQRTLRTQLSMKPTPAPPSSFPKRHSHFSDNASLFSPKSDYGGAPSVYSLPVGSNYVPPSPSEASHVISPAVDSKTSSQAIAQYLRSARLTTLLKLTRSPHASQDNPLTISLSDLGSQTGFPVVIFLGLGCVRHIMGLYDEMAEFLGLRLITIDRWGLGRTEPRSKSAKGIIQWASVVEEVLDILRIGQCSILAHSAGAPYALSFANKLPARIRGDICLLAPWVGGSENSGYKWLKYVPNGILKTAQAAEWKIQAWMIGKPPSITYQGIGYDAPQPPRLNGRLNPVYPSQIDAHSISRPSLGSSSFSEYDDLRDFEGRFESRSTLGAGNQESKFLTTKPKSSKRFLERLKGSTAPPDEKPSAGKKLKGLRSMGSLKGKSSTATRKSTTPSPQIPLPPPLQIEVDLNLDDLNWTRSGSSEMNSWKDSSSINTGPTRSSGRRSISFTSPMSVPSSPTPSAMTSNYAQSITSNSTSPMTLSNALFAASHAESAKGTHNDLLQILNHDNQPWGFSYSTYPHKVRLWYGDRDEKIAENAVRWMERTMGSDRCTIKVVRGADHALMFNTEVVLEVFDYILSTWKVGEPIARRPASGRR